MDSLRIIGGSLCVAMAATAIFAMLVPQSKLDRVVRFAVNLFFLCALVSPFIGGKLSLSADISALLVPAKPSPQQLEQEVDRQFSELAAHNLENSLTRLLELEGIAVQKVDITINKSNTSNIHISKLAVTADCTDPTTQRKINDLVSREVGLLPEIVNTEEGEFY